MRFFRETRIDFLGKKLFAIGLSVILIATCIGYVATTGLSLGIDFAGGNLIHLKYIEPPPLDELRARLATIGYSDATLQADEARNEVMIRVQREEAEAAPDQDVQDSTAQAAVVERVVAALLNAEEQEQTSAGKINLNIEGRATVMDLLRTEGVDPLGCLDMESYPEDAPTPDLYARAVYSDIATQIINQYRERRSGGIISSLDAALQQVTVPAAHSGQRDALIATIRENCFVGRFSIIRAEMVSAVVGGELGQQALGAIIWSLCGILVYIWFRFNTRFSVAAIIALVHDVLITAGIFAMSGREFNLPIVGAILTIVGYSLNDTIVVFDRIRENLLIKRREAKEDYEGVLNMSINQTLSRTLLTSMTTMVVVLFLYFMGGSVINDFAFTLLIGVAVGTYSSIFIASPVLALWQKITGTVGGQLSSAGVLGGK